MAMQDQSQKLKIRPLFYPIAAVTNNTAFVSNIIDTIGFNSLTLAVVTGSIADVDATFTALMEHGDNAALSDAAAVPDAMLVGTEAGMAPLFSNDNTASKIGYTGDKRYVRLTITPAANTGDIYLSGISIQGNSVTFSQEDQKVT